MSNIVDMSIEDKMKTINVINEMLAQRYEFWCGRHGIDSENPEMFSAMFFRTPSSWQDKDIEYFEYINSYENAGHGMTLLEAVKEAREITIRKGL